MDVKQFARVVREHIREDYDCVIAVTSIFEGEGKSTLCEELSSEIGKDLYDMEKNTLFNPKIEQIKDQVLNLPKYSVINADEAIKILYKLRWYDKMSIFLNQLYALARYKNLVSLFAMPRYRDFTEYFRNHKIKFWIHIIDRGHAVVFVKDWNPFTKDPWHMDENDKIIRTHRWKFKSNIITTQDKINILKRCQNFMGYLTFDDMPEDKKVQYMKLREKHKFDDITITLSTNSDLKLISIVDDVMKDQRVWFQRKGTWKVNGALFRALYNIRGEIAKDIKAMADHKVKEGYKLKWLEQRKIQQRDTEDSIIIDKTTERNIPLN